MIVETSKPSWADLFTLGGFESQSDLEDISLVGSGKGAIAIILQHLRERGVIKNKLDEILVPDWLGYWVYNQIQPYCFPAKTFSERTKAIFVYHQYGFPQNMQKIMDFAREKKLIVIEDCAHAVKSFYNGTRVGWLGDYALFSFSKWFFCYGLGGVRSREKDFPAFVKNLVARTPISFTFLKDMAKFFYEFTSRPTFLRMSYALYGEALKASHLAKNLLSKKLKNEIELREKRYQYFLEKTKDLGTSDHLEKSGISPYVIPIISKNSRLENIVNSLRDQKVTTGIYQFDINRNMLSPNFVQSALIPCHSGISDKQFELITETVIKIHA